MSDHGVAEFCRASKKNHWLFLEMVCTSGYLQITAVFSFLCVLYWVVFRHFIK